MKEMKIWRHFVDEQIKHAMLEGLPENFLIRNLELIDKIVDERKAPILKIMDYFSGIYINSYSNTVRLNNEATGIRKGKIRHIYLDSQIVDELIDFVYNGIIDIYMNEASILNFSQYDELQLREKIIDYCSGQDIINFVSETLVPEQVIKIRNDLSESEKKYEYQNICNHINFIDNDDEDDSLFSLKVIFLYISNSINATLIILLHNFLMEHNIFEKLNLKPVITENLELFDALCLSEHIRIINSFFDEDSDSFEISNDLQEKLNISKFEISIFMIYLRLLLRYFILIPIPTEEFFEVSEDSQNKYEIHGPEFKLVLLHLYILLGKYIAKTCSSCLSIQDIITYSFDNLYLTFIVAFANNKEESHLDDFSSMIHSAYTANRYKKYDGKIEEMMVIAKRKIEIDPNSFHDEIIKFFKDNDKYKPLFEAKGFQKRFSDVLKAYIKDTGKGKIRGLKNK